MWDRKEIKATGKAAFKNNYWPCVLVSLIMVVIAGGTTVSTRTQDNNIDQQMQQMHQSAQHTVELTQGQTIAVVIAVLTAIGLFLAVVILLDIFLFNPINVGCYTFFRKNVAEGGAKIDTIKSGFGDYGHTFGTMFLTDLYVLLWSLLFIIPGLIKSYSYCMVPYILKDQPELSANEVITRSRQLMDGHKWNAFVLDLSFIGWLLLTILTLGLAGVFWTFPYMDNTHAALYLKLLELEDQK